MYVHTCKKLHAVWQTLAELGLHVECKKIMSATMTAMKEQDRSMGNISAREAENLAV